MQINEKRNYFLDLLRIIACFLVIVNHTNSWIFMNNTPSQPVWFVSMSYFFISKIAVPIFIIISGYLLLGKADSWKKSFQRLFRIVAVLLVSGFVYVVFYAVRSNPATAISITVKKMLTIYLESPTNSFWYLYVYIGILLMLPFLQKLTSLMKRKDYHIFFVISFVCLSVIPVINHYIPLTALAPWFEIPIFHTYIFLLFLGQYFSKFEIKKTKTGFLAAAVLFVAMLAFNVVATFFEYTVSNENYLFFEDITLFPIVIESVCVFYMVSFVRLPSKAAKIISHLGATTFGIYLISDLTIEVLYPVYASMCAFVSPMLAVIIFEAAVFVIGYVITLLLKKIPFVKKVL